MNKTIAMLAAIAVTAAVPNAASADTYGWDRLVLVENLSSKALHDVQASPISADDWKEDLLGDRTVPSGESINVDIDYGTDECTYDLKAVMADGEEHIQREVDVCAVSKWVIGETGSSIE
jgi:hypothetical protein